MTTVASPLYPLLKKFVDDAWIVLDRNQISPWATMSSGAKFQVTDFYGKTIAYQGIQFEGSPRDVFWGRYIEPFLEDQVDKTVFYALRLSTEKKQKPRSSLQESAGLLKSLSRRAFARMAEVDQRLLGHNNSHSFAMRSAEGKLAAVEEFIDRRVAAELEMVQPRLKINEFYNEHPFLFWFIALLVGAVVTLIAG